MHFFLIFPRVGVSVRPDLAQSRDVLHTLLLLHRKKPREHLTHFKWRWWTERLRRQMRKIWPISPSWEQLLSQFWAQAEGEGKQKEDVLWLDTLELLFSVYYALAGWVRRLVLAVLVTITFSSSSADGWAGIQQTCLFCKFLFLWISKKS